MTLKPVPPLAVPSSSLPTIQDPYYVVMVIEGVVFNVMTLEGAEAAKFLAQPTFIQVEDVTGIVTGDRYDAATGTFTKA